MNAEAEWRVARDPKSNRWVGVCDALKVTAEGETWAQLCQVVNDVHNALFQDLLEEGDGR